MVIIKNLWEKTGISEQSLQNMVNYAKAHLDPRIRTNSIPQLNSFPNIPGSAGLGLDGQHSPPDPCVGQQMQSNNRSQGPAESLKLPNLDKHIYAEPWRGKELPSPTENDRRYINARLKMLNMPGTWKFSKTLCQNLQHIRFSRVVHVFVLLDDDNNFQKVFPMSNCIWACAPLTHPAYCKDPTRKEEKE